MAKYKAPKNRPYYRGVRGVYFIFHGEWSDPEIFYKGMLVNYWEIDNALWSSYKEEGFTSEDNEEFSKWVRKNSELLKEFIYNLSNVE